MTLPPVLQNLPLPIFGAPLFIISNPKMVIEQCKAGVVGCMPALNARPASQLPPVELPPCPNWGCSSEQDAAGLGELGHSLTGSVCVTAAIGMGGPHCIAEAVLDEDTIRGVVGSETKQLQRPSSVIG